MTASTRWPVSDPDAVPAGAKLCTGCDRVKPLDAFHRSRCPKHRFGRQARCKVCRRLAAATPEARAKKAAWRARPEVREQESRAKKRLYETSEAYRAKIAAHRNTVRARLTLNRAKSRNRAVTAKTEAGRASAAALALAYDREIERYDRERQGDE